MGDKKATTTPVKRLGRWVWSRTVREKVTMGVVVALVLLVLLKIFIKKNSYFFVATQVANSVAILILIYKLTITKTCAGLSLKTQELTAIFLAMRVICHFTVIQDIHILLDSLTLVSTLWVIYTIRFKLKRTYMQALDNTPLYYVLVPCAVIALIGHPGWQIKLARKQPQLVRKYFFLFEGVRRYLFIYNLTIEAVSVLPQLRLIQNAKMVEPFTAHYFFAMGVARFFAFANWILMLINSRGAILTKVGKGSMYLLVAPLSEVVQTLILADFCYHYVKSVMKGQRMMRLPSIV